MFWYVCYLQPEHTNRASSITWLKYVLETGRFGHPLFTSSYKEEKGVQLDHLNKMSLPQQNLWKKI